MLELLVVLVLLIAFVVMQAAVLFQVSGARGAAERQVELMERMGRAAGWLPPGKH